MYSGDVSAYLRGMWRPLSGIFVLRSGPDQNSSHDEFSSNFVEFRRISTPFVCSVSGNSSSKIHQIHHGTSNLSNFHFANIFGSWRIRSPIFGAATAQVPLKGEFADKIWGDSVHDSCARMQNGWQPLFQRVCLSLSLYLSVFLYASECA